jgi:hypothetical protein
VGSGPIWTKTAHGLMLRELGPSGAAYYGPCLYVRSISGQLAEARQLRVDSSLKGSSSHCRRAYDIVHLLPRAAAAGLRGGELPGLPVAGGLRRGVGAIGRPGSGGGFLGGAARRREPPAVGKTTGGSVSGRGAREGIDLARGWLVSGGSDGSRRGAEGGGGGGLAVGELLWAFCDESTCSHANYP